MSGDEVVEIPGAATHVLRKAVLRDGTAATAVVFDGDDDPDSFHLAAWRAGEIVAIGTWLHRRWHGAPMADGMQLRGMATAAHARGTGAGAAVLRAGIERCRAAGAELVWAQARDTAQGFYVANGFEVVGPGYTTATGLPHHDIVLWLDAGHLGTGTK